MMEAKRKNRVLIIVIVAAFLSPVVLSWWMLNYTDVVADGGKSNYGDLIDPPTSITDLDLHEPLANKDYKLHGKWNMVYVSKTCGERCMANLYRMRQIHIAMDKHSLRVQRVLIIEDDMQQDYTTLFSDYAGQRVVKDVTDKQRLIDQFKITETDNPANQNRIYIIDPLGNLMMSYPPDINPRGIIKDLKKLLRSSRIG